MGIVKESEGVVALYALAYRSVEEAVAREKRYVLKGGLLPVVPSYPQKQRYVPMPMQNLGIEHSNGGHFLLYRCVG